MNKKLIFATVATAQGVKADEVQGTATAGTETSGVTASNSGRSGEEKNETAQVDKQPTAETTNAEAGSESNNTNQSGVATNDNDI